MVDLTVMGPIPPVLVSLRTATGEIHKAVERLTPFFRPDFDRDGYLKWLHLMHGFYGVAEHAIKSSRFDTDTDWAYVSRRALIEQDLATLSATMPEAQLDSTGVLSALQKLRETPEIAGMLYVIEGSALGGNVLQKMLSRKAMVTPKLGASFFAPHGDEPNARWRDYVRLLAHLSTTANVEKAIVDSAVTTFNALQNWIVEGERA